MAIYRTTMLLILAVLCIQTACGVVQDDNTAKAIQQLKSPDAESRVAAADYLSKLGPAAAPAVGSLREGLADRDPFVRAHAARALGKIGEPARPALGDLAGCTTDDDKHVRRAAMFAIFELNPDPKTAVPLAIKALGDKEQAVVVGAIHTLVEFGPAVVPATIETLKDPRTAYYGCLVLSELGPGAKQAVPALTDILSSPESEVRQEAALALSQIGPAAKSAVPALVKRLGTEQEPSILLAVIFAIGKIGEPAAAAVPVIETMRAEGDDQRRVVTAWCLAAIQPDDNDERDRSLQTLIDALQNPDRRVRIVAAQGLLDLNPKPADVMPQITQLMRTANEETTRDILDTLASLGKDAVPALIEALDDEQVRLQAIQIIGRIGPNASGAVPALIRALSEQDPTTQAEVLFALASIGPQAEAAVPGAVAALGDNDPAVRFGAVYALGRVGPPAAKAIPLLLQGLNDDDPYFSTVCAWALVQIDPENEQTITKALPHLTDALTHRESFVRAEAATTLGNLGTRALPALAALERAIFDEDEGVRQAAMAAIKRIQQSQTETDG